MDLFGEPLLDANKVHDEPELIEENPAHAPTEAGLRVPRETPYALGHERVERLLLESLRGGRLPHGLVFAGPPGIGKSLTAFRLAKFLLSGASKDSENLDTHPALPAVRRIAAGAHADMMTVERAYDSTKNKRKDSIAVSDIRKIPAFLRMTAADGGWRIVIVDDSDTMNRNAQNAILKSLEEPPENTLLILIAHRPGHLIPTIRSRTQTISFAPLSHDAMETLLTRYEPEMPPSDRRTLAALAQGSIGRALELNAQGGLDMLTRLREALALHPAYDWTALHALADDMARPGQDESLRLFQELLIQVLSAFVGTRAREEDGRVSPLLSPFSSTFGNFPLERLLGIRDKVCAHFEKAQGANLEPRQAVLGAFSILAD